MPRFRVTSELPAVGLLDYKCERCGSLLHIDTDWKDPDLKADLTLDPHQYEF